MLQSDFRPFFELVYLFVGVLSGEIVNGTALDNMYSDSGAVLYHRFPKSKSQPEKIEVQNQT